jgi:transposase
MHKAAPVRTVIENAGHQLIFLPPYSPQLNPIEELFSMWKGLIRTQNCRSVEDLMAAINNIHDRISEDHCASFYDHMQVFIAKTLREE